MESYLDQLGNHGRESRTLANIYKNQPPEVMIHYLTKRFESLNRFSLLKNKV